MSETAIKIGNLTKVFKVYDDVFADRLKEKLFFWKAKSYYREFTALDDISLKIERGEVVGLIGPNGAGKTTFLKILAKICYPTRGEVEVNGSLIAVLSLGLGFNPRFTGRENIAISGTILGMSLKEIKEKEDWIIDFSELRPFIDQPVRTYSTGMSARLSFSVAAAVSPDILIIDEALATGDAFFVQKALGRIHEICNRGTTAVFVSHNMNQIQRLCDRVILIDKGKIKRDGPAVEIIKEYNDLIFKHREHESLSGKSAVVEHSLKSKDYVGNGDVVVDRVYFEDEKGGEVTSARTGEKVSVCMEYTCRKDVENARMIMRLDNYSGVMAYVFQSDNYFDAGEEKLVSRNPKFKKGRGAMRINFDPLLLTSNRYLVSMTIYNAELLLDKDSSFYEMTIFDKRHMAELSVFKYKDLNVDIIFEHPVTVERVEKPGSPLELSGEAPPQNAP